LFCVEGCRLRFREEELRVVGAVKGRRWQTKRLGMVEKP
jgi:hypothetical protein